MSEYASYCVTDRLPALQISANAAETRLRAAGDYYAADKILRAYIRLTEGLFELGERMSIRGTELLKRHEEDTQVRPDTLGYGGPRLEDYLQTDHLTALVGSLGIADYDLLDQNVPWWITNEIGNSALVGRKIFGAFFNPGGEERRPSGAEEREHAIFEPRGRGEFRGSGIIEKPIPARYFVRSAVAEIEAEWRVGVDALINEYIRNV